MEMDVRKRKLNYPTHHSLIWAMCEYVRKKYEIHNLAVMVNDQVTVEFGCTFVRTSDYSVNSDIYMTDEEITRALFKLGLTL